MLETSQCLRTRSQIIELRKLDNNTIAICTNYHGIRLFSLKECKTLNTIIDENLNSAKVTFSPNGEFVAFAKNNYIYVLHMPSKIIIKKIQIDTEIIELIEFDLESKYIIAATQSGRILQYRYDGSSLLARLYSFSVSKGNSFAFFNQTLACGGVDGTLFTINLHSRANKIIFKNDSNKITGLAFIDEFTLASANDRGDIFFNSLKTQELIKKMQSGFTKINQLVLIPGTKYMIVSGDQPYIAIYDIEIYKLIHTRYVEFEAEVLKMVVADKETILVSLDNKSLVKVKLPDRDKLKQFIAKKDLPAAYSYVKKHSMLRGTKEFVMLETAYKKLYDKALEALMSENNKKATEILKIFQYTDEKKIEIASLFKAFENYPRFKRLYIEKKYALAYAISTKFPALENTYQFKKMEEIWEDAFKNAQRQIAHANYGNAKAILDDYITVLPKRPIIKLILNDNDNFLRFLKAIELKDYKTIDEISKTNPLFKKIPTYKDVSDEMRCSIKDIKKDIKNCNLDIAIEKLTTLHKIESIKDEIESLKDDAKIIKKLQDAYKDDQFLECYMLIDRYQFLSATKLGQRLQKHWHNVILECESNALKGNIKEIKLNLGELINLESRRDKIGDLFRVSFHSMIKGLLSNELYKKAEALIYSYIDIFGSDNEIISIMKLYEKITQQKLAITQDFNKRAIRDKWIESDIIMSST
jgi:hypothetical protein